MFRRLRPLFALPVVLAALVAGGGARAATPQTELAPGPAGDPTTRGREPAVRLVVQAGFDYGFEEELEVRFVGGGEDELRANGGVFYALGATFLPFADGRLYTQATLGLKFDTIDADNGSASFLVFPLEVIEYYHRGPLRVGAGLSLALGARTHADGVLASSRADYDPSAGLVLTADYVWRFRGAARGFLTAGPRVLLQRLRTRGGALDAHAAGAVLGLTF
jgi:hypothetical protein